jgi:hypothetical protein
LVGLLEVDLRLVVIDLFDDLAELNRASTSFSSPSFRRAACTMPSSRAPMITLRSMPLSFAT